MQKRHRNRIQYFEEQDYTTRKYVIPFISSFRTIDPGMRILEIGCGEGGNLRPFLELGCKVTGIDLACNKIDLARSFFAGHPQKGNLTLICDDIYDVVPPEYGFDLIFMRDVMEHIHNQEKFMVFVKSFIKSGGLFFLAFPPWQNPFGGHQQVCRNKILSRLPYFHILPERCYRFLLKAGGESDGTIGNLLEVRETRLSVERFMKILKETGYHVISRRFYFINPNYDIKFNLKPVRQSSLVSRIPFLRNFLTTSVYYLITPHFAKAENQSEL
jgi:SAM-dependent methyltransferase